MIAVLLAVAAIYLASGALFAVGFVTFGVGAIDATAKGASLGFRLLILPGSVALWPYLLIQWTRARKQP